MTIETRCNDRREWTLIIYGRIDNITVSALREAVNAIPSHAAHLVLDFRDVLYISSAGLREMLICRKRYPGDRLLIRNVNSAVMEILAMTGFDQLLPIEA